MMPSDPVVHELAETSPGWLPVFLAVACSPSPARGAELERTLRGEPQADPYMRAMVTTGGRLLTVVPLVCAARIRRPAGAGFP